MNANGQLTPLQQRIAKVIRETRARYHACTASEIGRRLKFDKNHITRQLRKMEAMGVVAFMAEMPGSIWLVGEENDPAPTPLPPPAPGSAQQVIRTVEVGSAGDVDPEFELEPVIKKARTPAQIAASKAAGQRMKDKAAERAAQRAAETSPSSAAH